MMSDRQSLNTKQKLHTFKLILIGVIYVFLCALLPYQPLMAAEEIVIVIDPGHGGLGNIDESELGAKYHDVFEKDLTLETAYAMKYELETYGNVKVYMTREDDRALSLEQRAEYAESVKADMLISLHYNASAKHNFYGSEVWVSAFGEYYAKGYGAAACVMTNLTKQGFADRGIKTKIGKKGDDYYGIIRQSVERQMPAIIIEHGHIDHEIDWSLLGSKSMQEKLGVLDAQAIAAYYGLQKGVVLEKIQPAISVAIPKSKVMPDETEPQNISVSLSEYGENQNEVKLLISAEEKQSKNMYFGYKLDGEDTWSELILWEGKGSCEQWVTLPNNYEGSLQVIVYNNYNLEAVSESIPIAFPTELSKQKEKDNEKNMSNVLKEDEIKRGEEGDEAEIIKQTGEEGAEAGTDVGIIKQTGEESINAGIEEGLEYSEKTGKYNEDLIIDNSNDEQKVSEGIVWDSQRKLQIIIIAAMAFVVAAAMVITGVILKKEQNQRKRIEAIRQQKYRDRQRYSQGERNRAKRKYTEEKRDK